MRTTITITEPQTAQIDRVAARLGMKRLQCINYLITLGLSAEQFKGAHVDTAEGTLLLARLAEREVGAQVLVTPEQGDKSGRVGGSPR